MYGSSTVTWPLFASVRANRRQLRLEVSQQQVARRGHERLGLPNHPVNVGAGYTRVCKAAEVHMESVYPFLLMLHLTQKGEQTLPCNDSSLDKVSGPTATRRTVDFSNSRPLTWGRSTLGTSQVPVKSLSAERSVTK